MFRRRILGAALANRVAPFYESPANLLPMVGTVRHVHPAPVPCGMGNVRMPDCETCGIGKDSSSADPEGQISDQELERRVQAHAAFAAGVLHQEREEPEEAYAQFARAAEKGSGQ